MTDLPDAVVEAIVKRVRWSDCEDHHELVMEVVAAYLAAAPAEERVRGFRDACAAYKRQNEQNSAIIERYEDALEEAQSRIAALEAVLDEIANPLAVWRKRAEAEGHVLSSHAAWMADNASTLKEIARAALAHPQAAEETKT